MNIELLMIDYCSPYSVMGFFCLLSLQNLPISVWQTAELHDR